MNFGTAMPQKTQKMPLTIQKTQNGLLVFGLFYREINSNEIFHSHSYRGFL